MEAARHGHTDVVKLLLQHEASVNAKEIWGQLHDIITLYLIIVSLVYSIYLYAYIQINYLFDFLDFINEAGTI